MVAEEVDVMVMDNRSEVRNVLVLTLVLNLVVLVFKAVVGWLTGALSLQADALHSFTDSANNILGLWTNQISSPQPDRDHPYGHHKFEAIGALGIAAFLGLACFEILQQAVTRLFHDVTSVQVSTWEWGLLLVVLGINIFVAFYERSIGRQINSPILIADAKHTMGDIWVTIIVLGGLIGIWQAKVLNIPQLQWLDVILAFPVALLVFKSGWEVLKDNLPWLVDEIAIAPEVIQDITMEVPGVLNCHDIASRGLLGRQVFIEMHMIVDVEDVDNAHKITEEVEARLTERFSPVRIFIHIEPPEYSSERLSYGSDSRSQ